MPVVQHDVLNDLCYRIFAATGIPTVRPARDILPSVESIEQQMRFVMENRDEARARARLGCEYVRGRFTWQSVAATLCGMVDG